MKRLSKVFLVLFVCFAVFSLPLGLNAQDDFGLPPPPDADEDLLPPPPGLDVAGADLPPPPGEDFGDELPPPAEELAGEDELPPPPGEEMDDELPPPMEMADDEELPPPDEDLAPPPKKKPAKVASRASSTGKYTVVSGDCLWDISGKSKIYGDSFQWPLLFKANRDIIEDPDLIYPRQKLTIKRNYSQAEIEDAIKKAKETPPYEPHTLPRKKLPIKY